MAKKKAEPSKEQIEHVLVPKHEKLSEDEKKKLLDHYKVSQNDLPYIHLSDPAIRHLEPKQGDVIKIYRTSMSAGKSVFYRVVIND